MLSLTDSINLIYLARKNNEPTDHEYHIDDIIDYLDYMRELAQSRETVIDEKEFDDSEFKKNAEFFSKFKLNLEKKRRKTIKEKELLKLISKIEKNEELLKLTEDEFSFLFSSNQSLGQFTEYLNQFDLPFLVRQSKQDCDFYKTLENHAKNDSLFRNYKITNLYEVHQKRKTDFSKYKHSMRCVHGTKNYSLLPILNDGFMTPKQLKKTNNDYSLSGQALGDGVYFARLEQISKSLGYIDTQFSTRYMIVADLYYNDIQHTNVFKTFNYNGQNLVHAHSLGEYNRDEIVVLPEQIDIKFIVEIEKKLL